jgi:two-component system cell cycle sensor histidine kinase/response regulator CckA
MTKILVVDDNETDRYMLRVLLTTHGYEVVVAANGAEALETARRDRPDMIITDIMMPIMDGFSLCREWKRDAQLQAIPFVFYTATFTDPRDLEFALSLGADRFIVKPTEPDVFIWILLEVIQEHEAGQLVVHHETNEEETVYLKEYSAALVRKLEDKLVELERTNQLLKHDVARRKRAEAALRRSEEQYRDLYDNAPDGYCVVDVDGLIREMNATQLSWLGYSRRKVIDQLRLEDLLLPEERRRITELLDQCKREGQLEHVEQTLVCGDGRHLPVRLNMRAVRDAAGQYASYRVTTRDISKEKELEAQLLQAQKLESLGTLAGGIAHDFNNVLTGILGFTELLLQEMTPEDRMYADLRKIEVLSVRAANMVRQLMTFSRHSPIQKTSLALQPFLKEIIKLLERLIPENIKIELRLAAEDVVVEADPNQLQQVIINLAVNARDAMPAGGRLVIETARVELDGAFCQAHPNLRPGWSALVSVSDMGVGIPPEIRPYIFDPFYTTKGVGQGTGLGLPVVYGIVRNHDGAIEVESRVNGGTTMKIYLPLSEQPVVKEATPSADVLAGTETVLLVEDEPLVLEFGRVALEYFGYRVLTAQDGVEALEVFQAHQDEIALAILDVVMPRLGGRETARELKRRKPTLAVLLATGYDSPEEAGAQLGATETYELLWKPYRIRELARAVRAVLEHRSVDPQS